jgi:predicted Fe-S protein YdhL (DUF1289 family)
MSGQALPNSDDVPSPCISVCKLDTATKTCTGCGRHLEEIRLWTRMEPRDKQAVLDRLAEGRPFGEERSGARPSS